MNYFEIKPDGQAFIRTDSGTIIRKVGDGESVNHAEFNSDESLFVICYNSGKCEMRDRKNNLVKVVAEKDVKEAYFRLRSKDKSRKLRQHKEEIILLIMNDGSSEEYLV